MKMPARQNADNLLNKVIDICTQPVQDEFFPTQSSGPERSIQVSAALKSKNETI